MILAIVREYLESSGQAQVARIPKFFGAAWLRHRSLVCGTTAVTEGRVEGGESRVVSRG